MNIFFLSQDPKECAQSYFDKHVTKMITEMVQILCCVYYFTNPEIPEQFELFYKKTHYNHPSCKWARESIVNFNYIILLVIELNKEHQYRYSPKNEHKSMRVLEILQKFPPTLPNLGLTPIKLAMPEQFKQKDVVEAYRNYYMSEQKQHLRSWKKRSVPSWFKINEIL